MSRERIEGKKVLVTIPIRKMVSWEHSNERHSVSQEKAEARWVWYLTCEYERLYVSENAAEGFEESVGVIFERDNGA